MQPGRYSGVHRELSGVYGGLVMCKDFECVHEFPRGLHETWLQVTEGGDTDGQENIETIQSTTERTDPE